MVEETKTKIVTKTLPVVKLFSKYFAGRQISVERAETQKFGDYPHGVKVRFAADGFAEANPEQALLIELNPAYDPFVIRIDEYEKEYEVETADDEEAE